MLLQSYGLLSIAVVFVVASKCENSESDSYRHSNAFFLMIGKRISCPQEREQEYVQSHLDITMTIREKDVYDLNNLVTALCLTYVKTLT